MSEGQGSISYTGPSGAGSGFINVAGARNGLSVDTGSFIVLGQDVAAAGNPALLLNAREVPMAGFELNFINGPVIVSSARQAGAGERLGVYDIVGAGVTKNIVSLKVDSSAAGAIPTVLDVEATVPGTPSITTPGAFLRAAVNGNNAIVANYNGVTIFSNPADGVAFLGIQAIPALFGIVSNTAALKISTLFNTAVPFGVGIDIDLSSAFTITGGTGGYTGLFIRPNVNATAGNAGEIVGVDFNPGIASATGKVIAFRNAVGDVILQANGTQGKVGIRGVTTPAAWVHIGAGTAAAGTAPIKLNSGVLMTTPEQGAIEFNGVNFFATRVATREEILVGNNAAAAPATTATPVFTSFYGGNTKAMGDPNTWIAVNFAGTIFKIPAYS